jgi:mRNA deadenylase 3'-5' endonuclease subunit Ccr4
MSDSNPPVSAADDLKDWPKDLPLIERTWESVDDSSETSTDLTFKVMQFNVLAHGLSCPESNYGGFDKIPRASLEWRARRHKLLEVILKTDADIICLEEW